MSTLSIIRLKKKREIYRSTPRGKSGNQVISTVVGHEQMSSGALLGGSKSPAVKTEKYRYYLIATYC